jgi:hypothetical protein
LFIISSFIRLARLLSQAIPVETIATGKPKMGLWRQPGGFGAEFVGKVSVTT